jgi:hypothetical protein
MKARRGAALIVVLGTLALLALAAVTFTTLAGVERSVSRNYLDHVRARLVAQSGVETALARLRSDLERGALPRTEERAVEGAMGSGTYSPDGDRFAFRVVDANSRINVNDGVAWGPDHGLSRNLRRLLNLLGAQPTVDVPGLGDRILDGRPVTGYASKFDLMRALKFDREAFGRVRDFLTVASWSDPNVAMPVPLSPETAALYPALGARPFFRRGHQKDFRGRPVRAPLLFFDPQNPDPSHPAVWGRDSLFPGWIEGVSRSPVNVNSARREVLMALLIDLEGFFLVERRRDAPSIAAAAGSPCGSPGGAYAWTALRYTYDASGNEGDECGLLYRTFPIIGPGGRHAEGIPASAIVEEILACREGRPSPGIAGLDYSRAPFGGPFRSWAQFGLFSDELARRGILADPRAGFFWDWDASGARRPGSPLQLQAAAQAVADVLKANFNPNLHLNEINPDRNLFAHVDKTDLLAGSTEFCFTPMGVFEIDSEGRIERPADGVVARSRCEATVRLYDARRETSQAQFSLGEIAPRRGGPETGNNRSLECGPEPDNGEAPAQNRYEGYLRLATVGSNLTSRALKPSGELWTTLTDRSWYPGAKTSPPGGAHLGSALHAHFQLDHAAHHHGSRSGLSSPPFWDGFRVPQGAWQTVIGRRACLNRNWGDLGEPLPGPYGPVDATRAPEAPSYRLARSFTGETPRDRVPAPSDLRLDGAYVERDSAFGYWIDESASFNFNEGAAAFWLKPAFFPGMTGKRRTLLSAGRYHAHAPGLMNPSPFGLFFVPPHDGIESAAPLYAAGIDRFRPASLAFGFGLSSRTGYNWEMGREGPDANAAAHAFVFGPALNHEGHDDGRPSLLRDHEWIHVGVTWNIPRDRPTTADSARLYVNGRALPGTVGMPHRYAEGAGEGEPFRRTPSWTTHSLQALVSGAARWCKNSIRLGGEPSLLFDLPGEGALFPGNFAADATFDEFYLWLDRSPAYNGGLWGIQTLWSRGRFYRPDDRRPEDARFTSGPVDLGPASPRRLPPGEAAPAEEMRQGSETRILGISWTEVAVDYEQEGGASLRPRAFDASEWPPRALRPEASPDANGVAEAAVADLWVEIDGAWYGPYRGAGWSPVRTPEGLPPAVRDASSVRYAAKLKSGGPGAAGLILLASPALDDVTLFVERGGPAFLSWASEP